MLGKEIYTVARPLKSQTDLNIAWAFPNTYNVGMASLGYQLVWWLLEQEADTLVKRVFTDCQESNWQAAEMLGFTLSWELDYVNVLKLIRQAGIQPLAKDRQLDSPLVFGGGPVLSANPEPFAEFFDVIALGDAEATITQLLSAWRQARQLPSRAEQLQLLAQTPGLYVPSLYSYELESQAGPITGIKSQLSKAEVRKQAFSPPDDYVAHSLMLSPQSAWADMFLVEVVRSCPQECRFCLASYLTRPFRAAPVETLLQKIDIGLTHTRKIGLLGPSVTEHPQFDQLAEGLLARPHTEISLASVRVDSLNPLVVEMLAKLGQKSLTMAIESGSERLRAIMKKNLSEAEIFSAVDLIAKSGLSGVKFYGIVGLPEETQTDLDETVRLLLTLKKTYKQLHFVFGISSFVPKAQTPFQWAGRDLQCKHKLEYLRKKLAVAGIEVRPESHNWSDIQTLLSRGDRRLTPVLLDVADSPGKLGDWQRALRRKPADCPGADHYISRQIPYLEVLPWSHLVTEAKSSMLFKHDQDARNLSTQSADLQPS